VTTTASLRAPVATGIPPPRLRRPSGVSRCVPPAFVSVTVGTAGSTSSRIRYATSRSPPERRVRNRTTVRTQSTRNPPYAG